MGVAWSTVNEARQWSRLMEMGEIGAIAGPDGARGVNRACLTPLDRRARRLLVS